MAKKKKKQSKQSNLSALALQDELERLAAEEKSLRQEIARTKGQAARAALEAELTALIADKLATRTALSQPAPKRRGKKSNRPGRR